ncbi:MAG: glycosyltransferase family 2 protein, partial [Thermoanaerobaculia bacterium]
MRTEIRDPEVTVVIPVWRADPSHLREALASVSGQTLTNFEVIIIEDPSESPAESLVRAHGDPRIRYILNERRTC